MTQYIDKSDLIKKIDNLKHKIDNRYSYSNGWKDALRMVEAELDTLEVKEVDLDDVIENYIHENFGERWDGCVPVGCFELDSMAEHFYMLGFNARKEE